MASHVVVVDTTARRANVKTTPTKHLSDVLQEACAKFGVKPDLYILKFNNKALDLSRTIRLANLPQGAKLDLVQGSRSPTVINVALQPDGQPGQRYTQKFASTTSLWQILRIFETTSPGNPNFTQRGIAVTNSSGPTGAGRLNYEMPVINIMGRELGTVSDLQKTLAQLGFTSGSALLRLRFRDSGEPLEEAMAEISLYFKSLETDESETKNAHGAHAENPAQASSALVSEKAAPEPDTVAGESNPPEPGEPMEDVLATSEDAPAPADPSSAPASAEPTPIEPPQDTLPPNTTTGPANRPTQIYTPSANPVPQAARTAFTPDDYVPTADHARAHQALLATQSRNQRLASDAELAAAERAKADKLAAQASVTIRVRLPDQSVVETSFAALETGTALYEWVRGMLRFPEAAFVLKTMAAGKGLVVVPEAPRRLIGELGLQGRVLVNLVWGEGVGVEVRQEPCLRDEWRGLGREMVVKEPVAEVEERVEKAPAAQGKKEVSADDKESKVKNILSKGLFKKK